MHNYLKCKKNLNISDDITKKLDIVWEDVVFLIDMIDNRTGEFLINDAGKLFNRVTEIEKVDESEAANPGVIWGGSGYCRIKSSSWEGVDYTGTLTTKSSVLGKDTDADVSVEFTIETGLVISHTTDVKLIENTTRKSHDSRIKQCAILRAKKMSTRRYRYFDILIRKPLRVLVRGVGWIGSFLQDISWKLERQLNKI